MKREFSRELPFKLPNVFTETLAILVPDIFRFGKNPSPEDLIFFDLETTGLNSGLDQIVEIGAVKFDKKGLIARFSTLVNPGIHMPAEAERVNNITDEMLAGKPHIGEVLPDFLRFIEKSIIIAHNAVFDCDFINETLKNSPVSPFPALPNPIADTLVSSREAFPGLRSYSPQNLAAELRIPANNAHRAEDDARLCVEIFVRLLDLTRTRL
jgi:DNA polymerase-3 subunit epsilon